MSLIHHGRVSRIALLASGVLVLGSAAFAQTVRVFDDAPSIEQLRSIMIPESQLGLSRTIVIQRPDSGTSVGGVQRASTQVLPAPQVPVTRAPVAEPPVVQAAAKGPMPSAARAAKAEPVVEAGAVAFRVNFGFDSAALPDSAHDMVQVIARLMKESPEVKLRVEGHTDAIGSADYNVSLSERRALSVCEYLVTQGVEPSRLMLVGKGMAEPLSHDRFDPANRRVQFVRIK